MNSKAIVGNFEKMEEEEKEQETKKKSRMGRPFTGEVKDKGGKEDDVVISRALFRLVKKLYARPQFLPDYPEIQKTLNNLPKGDGKKVIRLIELLIKCKCKK